MATHIRSQRVTFGAYSDDIDIVTGPGALYKQIDGANLATTASISCVLAYSVNYADLLAIGAGDHLFLPATSAGQFGVGLAAGNSGSLYKLPSAIGASSPSPGAGTTSKKILGLTVASNVTSYQIATETGGLNANMATLVGNPLWLTIDSATAAVSGASLSSPSSSSPVFPSQISTYTASMKMAMLGFTFSASGQVVSFKYYASAVTAGSFSAITNIAGLPQQCMDFLNSTVRLTGSFTVTGMTAAEYLQRHPYFFIQWPFSGIRLNLHHFYSLASPL